MQFPKKVLILKHRIIHKSSVRQLDLRSHDIRVTFEDTVVDPALSQHAFEEARVVVNLDCFHLGRLYIERVSILDVLDVGL